MKRYTNQPLFFLISCCIIANTFVAVGQRNRKPGKGELLQQQKHEKECAFLQLRDSDKVADIGTGAGNALAAIYSCHQPVFWTAEDIDSHYCNRSMLERSFQHKGISPVPAIPIVIGTATSTLLPDTSFDKVTAFDLIHEMSDRKTMLLDLKRILRKDGTLIIEEILVHKSQPRDKACNYPYMTEKELLDLLSASGFQVVRTEMAWDVRINRYIKLFACIAGS